MRSSRFISVPVRVWSRLLPTVYVSPKPSAERRSAADGRLPESADETATIRPHVHARSQYAETPPRALALVTGVRCDFIRPAHRAARRRRTRHEPSGRFSTSGIFNAGLSLFKNMKGLNLFSSAERRPPPGFIPTRAANAAPSNR